jgi:hypothetical protein
MSFLQFNCAIRMKVNSTLFFFPVISRNNKHIRREKNEENCLSLYSFSNSKSLDLRLRQMFSSLNSSFFHPFRVLFKSIVVVGFHFYRNKYTQYSSAHANGGRDIEYFYRVSISQRKSGNLVSRERERNARLKRISLYYQSS